MRKKTKKHPYTAAIIAAAGISSRMGGENKLFAPLLGIPVIAYSLMAFERCEGIDEIIIPTVSESIIPIGDICKEFNISKATKILRGGDTRTASVTAALMNIKPKTEYIAIHDGARPLVRHEMIAEVLECAIKHGAAVPVVPLKDTIKVMEGSVVTGTTDRSRLYAVQTPQIFQTGLIKGALAKAAADSVELTDDCAALEHMGMRVMSVPGRGDNIKITTPEDIIIAGALLSGGTV